MRFPCARVGDLLWLRRRDANAARVAVKAYVASASRLENPEHWPACMERYERAVRLARQVEPKGELPIAVLAHLESRVRHYDGSDPLYFSLKALELLAEFRFGEFPMLAELAGRIASKSRGDGNYRRARSHFDVQAKLLTLGHDTNGAEAARVASAECHFEEAEAQEANGSYMVARTFWEKAVHAFRDRQSLRDRIPELQKRLAFAGKKTLEEMQSHGHEIDIHEMIEKVEYEFKGLSFDDALLKFAMLFPLIDPQELREETLASIEEYPLRSCIDAAVFDEAGRKIAKRPALTGADEKSREAAIEGFMDENARLHRSLSVHGYLAPAIRTILSEHHFVEADLERLIEDSAFIPQERLPLFVKAIVDGFRGDFSTALHVYIPQAENGLRYLLEQNDVIPRNMDKDGIEEVWSVERILGHPATKQTLGEALVYELQSLLAGSLGPNLRNCLAHGLLSPSTLKGESAFYLWWVLFRLTYLPTSAMRAYAERQRNCK